MPSVPQSQRTLHAASSPHTPEQDVHTSQSDCQTDQPVSFDPASRPDPRNLTQRQILYLQRTAGNRAVARLLERKSRPQTEHLTIQRSSTEADAGPAAETDRRIAAQKIEQAKFAIESYRATGQVPMMPMIDPFANLPQVHAGAVATKRTFPFTVDRGNGPETFRVPVNDLPAIIQQCQQNGWQYHFDERNLPRGFNIQRETLQRAATPSGYGGGTMNPNAAKPNVVAAPNLANGSLTYNGVTPNNTSTGAAGTDLNRQPMGTGVGATRPANWTNFITMIGGINPFKQGHQMYEYLGGEGTHDNLAPFTGSLNGLHYNRVEYYLWEQTDDTQNDQYADYSVTPNYGGNAGIVAWAQAQFASMTPANQRAAMVTAGIMTPAAAAAYLPAAPLTAPDLATANAWIATYVNATFPTDIDCSATFIDDTGGGGAGPFHATNAQNVNITNDF